MAQRNIFLGLDIGTNFVKAVISRSKKKEPLEILGTGYVEQLAGAMSAGIIMNIPAVTEACERAINEAEKNSGVSAKQVVVGMAGELVKTSTSLVHYHREKPNRPLSNAEMLVLLEKVQVKTHEKARKEIAFETDNPHAEATLINSAVISVTIDGQKVNNPIGFKGSDIIVEFYTAFAPEIHVRSIEKVCADLNLDLVAIAVDPFAICRALLGDDMSIDSPSVILDIGGGNTSIAVIDRDGIRGTETFSIGAKSIRRDASVWLSGLKIAFSDFSHIDTFPSNIIICGGGAEIPKLQEALALGNWYKTFPFARRPLIGLIETDKLPDLKNSTKNHLETSFITAIGLARIGADSLGSGNNDFATKFQKLLSH